MNLLLSGADLMEVASYAAVGMELGWRPEVGVSTFEYTNVTMRPGTVKCSRQSMYICLLLPVAPALPTYSSLLSQLDSLTPMAPIQCNIPDRHNLIIDLYLFHSYHIYFSFSPLILHTSHPIPVSVNIQHETE